MSRNCHGYGTFSIYKKGGDIWIFLISSKLMCSLFL
ncbi:MAG TPA: hypothetical protein [Caudoviricetes sp.]|nr:MAG TPA: hypothetical protein [Caudoviricetes sp.]